MYQSFYKATTNSCYDGQIERVVIGVLREYKPRFAPVIMYVFVLDILNCGLWIVAVEFGSSELQRMFTKEAGDVC